MYGAGVVSGGSSALGYRVSELSVRLRTRIITPKPEKYKCIKPIKKKPYLCKAVHHVLRNSHCAYV
jgi:hypothetical protein